MRPLLVRLGLVVAFALTTIDALRLVLESDGARGEWRLVAYLLLDAAVLGLLGYVFVARRGDGIDLDLWLAAAMACCWVSALWRGLLSVDEPALPFWAAVVLTGTSLLQVRQTREAVRTQGPPALRFARSITVLLWLAVLFYALTAVPLLFYLWFWGIFNVALQVALTALTFAYGAAVGWVWGVHADPERTVRQVGVSLTAALVAGLAFAFLALWNAGVLALPVGIGLIPLIGAGVLLVRSVPVAENGSAEAEVARQAPF